MASLSTDDLLPELEARLGLREGSLRGVDRARAVAVLSDAVDLVAAAVGSALADSPQPAARSVALSAARRAYLNPAGALSETVGPHTVRWDDDSPSGVYLTAAEQQVLNLLRRKGRGGGLWSLGVERGTDDGPLLVGDQLAPLSDPIPFEQSRWDAI